jgi:NADPH:quinone reductase
MSDYRLFIRGTGGPEVIEREQVGLLQPGPGEARVRHEAIGLNFIDTYQRSGLYPLDLPSGLGSEAAGVVEAVAEGVVAVSPGDRVGYAGGAPGAYATARLMPAESLIRLPDEIDAQQAAAALLKGMTAGMLIEGCARVQPGQWVLVHSANGGVGSIAVQWLRAIGARVIAHAGTAEKAEAARALGAEQALHCSFDALAEQVRALTGGRGVDAVLDGVGKDSWTASLKSLARRGIMVSFGNASGPVPPFAPLELARAGSLFLTRPTLNDYMVTSAERQTLAGRLFKLMKAGEVKVAIGQTFALSDAAEAHRAIEGRHTTGSTVLLP